MDLFWEIHKDLPREGPGDSGSTARAFALIKDLPSGSIILDIGCGPGMQTIDLLNISDAHILAIDTHQAFLRHLQEKKKQAGFTQRVFPANSSMFDLPFPTGSIDCIWSEGAIYIIGFENGLKSWKRLLKPGGYLAVTEISWLKPDPPAEVHDYWMTEYPAMHSVEENLEIASAADFDILGHFVLPDASWWNDYYTPIEKRLISLREKYRGDPQAIEYLDGGYKEMDIHRKFSAWYGYVFYVLKAR